MGNNLKLQDYKWELDSSILRYIFLTWGFAELDLFVSTINRNCNTILLKRWSWLLIPKGCLFHSLEERPSLYLSSNPIDSKSAKENQARQSQSHSNGIDLAKTSLIPLPDSTSLPVWCYNFPLSLTYWVRIRIRFGLGSSPQFWHSVTQNA